MSKSIIELKNIKVYFSEKEHTIKVVNNVSLQVEKADIYGIVGYSGAGKSTLVRVINLLQRPAAGKVVVNGAVLYDKEESVAKEISPAALRNQRRKIGMIFQHFNLLNEQTALKNVEFALKHSSLSEKERLKKAMHLLELVGLLEQKDQFPSQLSGGQQQRVALARALANDPKILISDEATSALDPKNTNQILDLLQSLNQKLGLTIVLITHEMEAVKQIANKVAVMENGQIIENGQLVDIFTRAKQPLTRELIGTQNDSTEALKVLQSYQTAENEEIYHLVYSGNSIQEPLTTRLYQKFNVETSIIYGNVDLLKKKPVGTLYVIFHGEKKSRQKAGKYLLEHGVLVEKVEREVI